MWLHTTRVPVGYAMKGALCSRVTIEVDLLEKGRLTREITRARSINFANDRSFKTANIQFQLLRPSGNSACDCFASSYKRRSIALRSRPCLVFTSHITVFNTISACYFLCVMMLTFCEVRVEVSVAKRWKRNTYLESSLLSSLLRLIVVCWNNPEKYLISQCRSIGFQPLLPGCIESVRRCFCETRPLKHRGILAILILSRQPCADTSEVIFHEWRIWCNTEVCIRLP